MRGSKVRSMAMSDKIKISVVIPCFNEEEVLPLFYDNLMDVSKIKVTAIKNSNPAGGKSAG